MTSINNAFETWGAPTLSGFDTSNPQTGVPLASSSRQFVRFYPKKVVQVYATEVEVNERFGTTKVLKTATREKELEMVEIITPGDTNRIDCIAEEYHKSLYWKQYEAFRNNKGAIIGKPLSTCDYVPAGQLSELKYLGCHTQEQLADASDLLCGRIADGFNLREFARAMVKVDLDNASLGQVNTLKSELAKAQEAIQKLTEQQKQIQLSMQKPVEVESKAERTPGKPRTNVQDIK